MPSPSVFDAFRLGVRLEQLCSFPDLPESAEIDSAKTSLCERLILAADVLRHREGTFGLVAASIHASRDLFATGSGDSFARMQSHANHWKDQLISASRQIVSSDGHGLWFELGVEIVRGRDNYTEGLPRIQEPLAIRQVLDFDKPRPHRWVLSNPNRVEELVRRLDITWDDVFRQPDGETRVSIFDELPESLSWAWCNIEHALGSLAFRLAPPIWDPDERTLTVRGEVVRRFKNPALNQMLVIEKFVKSEWSPVVDNPFKDQIVRRQTLEDLNESIDPKLIFFGGNGDRDGRLRWSFTQNSGSG